jgi:hypothetical protein
VSEKQKPGAVEEFKKNSQSLIQTQYDEKAESFLKQWKKLRYWSQDESRIGTAYNTKKKANRDTA